MDIEGNLHRTKVHEASIQDRDGAKLLLWKVKEQIPTLKKIIADGGYTGKLLDWIQKWCHCPLEIVKKPGEGFQVLPKRWIVERNFAWLGFDRRLSKDYEASPTSSEGFIYLSSLHRTLRRLAN